MSINQQEVFWIGGATNWGGEPAPGLRALTVSSATAPALSQPITVAPNPMFAAVTPNGGVVVSHEVEEGSLTLFTNGQDLYRGEPTSISTAKTGGTDPTNVAVVEFPSGRSAVLSANYTGGSLSVNPLHEDLVGGPSLVIEYSGSGPATDRQASSHPHQVVINQDSGEVLVPDLGADVVHVHRIEDLERGLSEHRNIRLPEGSGPRNLVVADGCALVACELDALVHVVSLESGELLTDASPSTPGDDAVQNFPSAIRITKTGHVLVGNRGPDTIGVLRWDGDAQSLMYHSEFLCGGTHPRDFQLNTAEDLVVVANLKSNDLAILGFDDQQGTLQFRERIPTGSPSCVVRQVFGSK